MKQRVLITLALISLLAFPPPEASAQKDLFSSSTLNKKTNVKIDDVINTATLLLNDGRRVRLIGLIPLERPKRKEALRNEYNIIIEQDDPLIPVEQTALDFVIDLVKKKEASLEMDTLYRDSDGYILGYIFLKDGTFVNAEILRQGFSDLRLTPQNTKYEKELRDAYREAKKEMRGIQGN